MNKLIKKIQSSLVIIWIFLLTFDITMRAIVQSWRGPLKMTRVWTDKTLQGWSQRSLNAAKVDLHVHNPHAVKFQSGQSYVVMCNHTSQFDIPISLLALPGWSVRMLTKKEMYSAPLFGKAMTLADFPMIDRKNRRQSLKDLAHARELMKSGIVIWVSPEGTRSKAGELGEFKRGAFLLAIEAKAMIIPMGIRGAHKLLPTHSLNVNVGERIDVFIGEPIDASQYTRQEKDVLLTRVRESIAALSQ
jgi:1-acyl-sn-glycerol-3-phosphate acyltransferase